MPQSSWCAPFKKKPGAACGTPAWYRWPSLSASGMGYLANDGHVGGGAARIVASEAWVVGDLDLALERPEARAKIEVDSAGVVEGARVHPKAVDRLGPRSLNRMLHEKAPGALADQARGYPEVGQLAHSLGAKIKLEQALVPAAADEGVHLNRRVADDGLECLSLEFEAHEPKPILPDATIEVAIPFGGRTRHLPNAQIAALSQDARRGWLVHLQMRDDGSNLARRDVGVAIREHRRSAPRSLRYDPVHAGLPLAVLLLGGKLPFQVALELDKVRRQRHPVGL